MNLANYESDEKQPPGKGSVGERGQEIKTLGTLVASCWC